MRAKMPVLHLTDVVVRGLKSPGTYTDKSTPGFALRVGRNRKTWFVIRGKERLRTNIGRYPAVPLADARKSALVLLGSAPEPKKRAPLFKEALESFFAIHLPTLKPSTQHQLRRNLERDLLPVLKHKRLDEIEHRDVSDITDALAKRAPSQAWHTFKDARIFFRWCVPRYVKHNPMEGLKSPTRYISRKRVLTDAELVAVWRSADKIGYPFGTALKLCILWGCRWGEVISCRRSYIDERNRVITLPETKNKTAHHVWYGQMTADILADIPRYNSTDLLFPGRDWVTPWNGSGKAKWQLKETCKIAPWQILDLRRSTATKWAEIGIPPYLVEKLLNHRLGTMQSHQGVVTAVAEVYNRAAYRPELTEAMAKWEARLQHLLAAK
jgi:integrase